MPGTCPICGSSNGRNKKACSHTCYSKLRMQYKTCPVCGTEFQDPQSNGTVCCSKECSRIHRQQLYDQGVNTAALAKAHAVLPVHPLTGRFETHINAKSWIVQAPDGQIYECRNLKNWLRDHENMLDGTVKQAWDGITKIKYTMQGKRPRAKSKSWKGWTLIEYGD